jgi:hypothetical protein
MCALPSPGEKLATDGDGRDGHGGGEGDDEGRGRREANGGSVAHARKDGPDSKSDTAKSKGRWQGSRGKGKRDKTRLQTFLISEMMAYSTGTFLDRTHLDWLSKRTESGQGQQMRLSKVERPNRTATKTTTTKPPVMFDLKKAGSCVIIID